MHGFVIGLDLGTSGVRAVAVDASGKILALGSATLPATKATGARREQSPEDWWNGCRTALDELSLKLDLSAARAIAVDATSGTILPVDNHNRPLAAARMYDDADTGDLAAKIKTLAPRESAAHGATSPAARALEWAKLPRLHCIIHQADWINGCLGATNWQTDENNALKTGYDPVSRSWPDWLRDFGLSPGLLPEVVPVGTPIGHVSAQAAIALARQAAEHGWSVREVEHRVQQLTAGLIPTSSTAKAKPAKAKPQADIVSLERELSESLNARVNVLHGRGGKGRLVIHYTDLDSLEGVLERLRGRVEA